MVDQLEFAAQKWQWRIRDFKESELNARRATVDRDDPGTFRVDNRALHHVMMR